jgi:phytoene/squalene synthetase
MFARLARLRPLLVVRGLMARRSRPDLAALAAEEDPERFMWRVLPHAARSFAASIVVLPRDQARAMAVGYLYSRMLDTYEDLFPDMGDRVAQLGAFAGRFAADPMPPPAPIPATLAGDDRDRVHLLLVRRCHHVDAVYRTLPRPTREATAAMIRAMADGMAWSTETMATQGGVLVDEEQVARYCRDVIGNPAVFALQVLGDGDLEPEVRRDAMTVGEMVQLANITRDIERDLERGIGYHPALTSLLPGGDVPDRDGTVRQVRAELTRMALQRAPAYRRVFEAFSVHRPGARAAAVMMLLFTDRHYRSCARRCGITPWRGPRTRVGIVARTLPAAVSARAARRTLSRVEGRFLEAAPRFAAVAGPASAW